MRFWKPSEFRRPWYDTPLMKAVEQKGPAFFMIARHFSNPWFWWDAANDREHVTW